MIETLAICDVVVWTFSQKHGRSVKSINVHRTHSWLSRIKPLCLPALIMLALITEKLQNQKLEDVENSTADAASTSVLPREDSRFSEGDAAPMVRGKNIWAASFTSTTDESCYNTQIKRDRDKLIDKSKIASPVICPHCKCLDSCSVCLSMPGTPPTPPKKRHCRSLTTPSDYMQSPVGKWQPRGSKLWKPIPSSSFSNNNKHFRNRNLNSSSLSQDSATSANNNVSCGILPTFKGLGSDSGHSTPSEFLTPPHSPVPRPSSASSGFCRSDESVSSLSAFWLENSPVRNKFQILQTRSLSLEDKISRNSAGSTSSVPATVSSTSESPVIHHIPRCRSQPCVLHDRKFCLKRRRESDRPSLNFNKMAETGYHPFPRSVPTDCVKRITRFHHEIESVMSLKPIASSPLDNDSLTKHMDRANIPTEKGHMTSLKESPGDASDSLTMEHSSEFDDDVTKCSCRDDSNIDIFPITDLDIEQIESH